MDERAKKKIYNDRRWKAVRPVVLARDGGVCQIKLHCCRTQATTVDHIVPLKDGGQNRETNMQLVAEKAHREKTAAENSARAKEQRMRMKNNGTWPKSKTPLRSRGFNPGRNRTMGE